MVEKGRTFLGILSVFCLLIAGGIGYDFYRQKRWIFETQTKQEIEKPLWVTDKPAPATIEPGAYLAAWSAVFNNDLQRTADLYLKVWQGDPDNEKTQREAYFFNAILGRFDVLRPVVKKMSPDHRILLLTDYVQYGYDVQDKQWAKMRSDMANRSALPLDEIVLPLLRGWSYVGEGNLTSAVKALEPLKKQKGLMPYYYYHQGLMALTLGNSVMADEAFQNMAGEKLLTVSMYPEIRDFYAHKGNWNLENPLYVQWKLFEAEKEATAELLMTRESAPMTANRGFAEAFYNLSTALGSTQTGDEGALILSALSLYLNPNQELPKIWNAEILEQANKPQLADYYYQQLKSPLTQTMEFKKASNFIACGREKEALNLLNKLKKTNTNNANLWLALADVYEKLKNWPAAVYAYTRILEIEGETNRMYASNIYFARSLIYAQMKQEDLSESDLQKALELNPNNSMLLNQLGYQWLTDDKKMTDGVKLIQKAYKLNPRDSDIIDSMAFAYYQTKEYKKALSLAEKAVDKMPHSSVANMHLGDIYQAVGRYREAQFQYQKALSLKYDLTPELKQEILAKIEKN